MTQPTTDNPRSCKYGLGRKTRLTIVAVTLIGLGTVGGALVATAFDASAHSAFGKSGPWSAFRGHGYHGAHSIEQSRERAQDVAAWVLGSVDATPEQSQRVKAIVANAVDELYPLREQHREHHRTFIDALSQPQLDRQALEQIREAELALASQLSERVVNALADTAEVLTVEQRQALMSRLQRFSH